MYVISKDEYDIFQFIRTETLQYRYIAPHSTTRLPPFIKARTGGIFLEIRTFLIQNFALSGIIVHRTIKTPKTQKAGTRQPLRIPCPGFMLCCFSLALIPRTLNDDCPERLFALIAALSAKPVILPPPIAANEYTQFPFFLFG